MVLLPLCAYLHLLLELGLLRSGLLLDTRPCTSQCVKSILQTPLPLLSIRRLRLGILPDITHRILRRLPVSLLLGQQGAHLRQLRPHVLLLSDELRDRRLLRCGLILDHLLLRLKSRVEGGLLLRQSHIKGIVHPL